jgi:hypothetical protein
MSTLKKLGWVTFGLVVGFTSVIAAIIFLLILSISMAYGYGGATGQLP